MVVAVPPSPNAQLELMGVGVDVLVKVTGSFTQTSVGALNELTFDPIIIGTAVVSVPEQPELLVTVSDTVKEPLVV